MWICGKAVEKSGTKIKFLYRICTNFCTGFRAGKFRRRKGSYIYKYILLQNYKKICIYPLKSVATSCFARSACSAHGAKQTNTPCMKKSVILYQRAKKLYDVRKNSGTKLVQNGEKAVTERRKSVPEAPDLRDRQRESIQNVS